jgi:hypothetical protein
MLHLRKICVVWAKGTSVNNYCNEGEKGPETELKDLFRLLSKDHLRNPTTIRHLRND